MTATIPLSPRLARIAELRDLAHTLREASYCTRYRSALDPLTKTLELAAATVDRVTWDIEDGGKAGAA